jgi:site-specific recombinase XerD
MVFQTECYTPLSSLLDTYQIQARTEGKSPNTIRIYTTALGILQRFLERRGLPTNVTGIGSEELREFIGYLQNTKAFMEHPFTGPQEKGLTGHTINCYLRAIRAFWSWLVAEEFIESNPFDKIKVPKPPKKVITPFSEEQIRSLLNAVDTGLPIGFRAWTIILTLLDTGIRVTELTNLKLEDFDLSQRCLKIRGKGNKERIVPIGISVQKALAKYINKYRPNPTHPLSNNLFLNRDGMPLTPNRIEAIIERYASKVKIQGVRASPHTFRHTFAISYLRNGGDVFTLQRILGHETLDMVRNYVNVAQYDLQEAHLRCSPVDNLKIKARHFQHASLLTSLSNTDSVTD